MKLGEILDGCEVNLVDLAETEITGIASDSRVVRDGYIFVCLAGHRFDGHDFASYAQKNGAVFILAEKMPDGVDEKRVILVPDTHLALSKAWYNFYKKPADMMTRIAITGTAGKTSIAYILRHILSSAGRKVGMITTIRSYSGDRSLDMGDNGGSSVSDVCGAMTTPDPEYFWRACAEMKSDGCDMLIYEASSQSILRKTTSAAAPDIAIFTNLSEEHLDAHGTMENYFAAKASLLHGVKRAVVNIDDEWIKKLPSMFPDCKFTTVSAYPEKVGEADVCALRYKSCGESGIEYVYFSDKAAIRVRSPMIGFHSVYNTIEAAACAILLGIEPAAVKESLEDMRGVDGRMHRVTIDKNSRSQYAKNLPSVFIDYAHTPKSLEAVCRTLSELKQSSQGDGKRGKRRLTVVFGCGGDRDKTKRPLMARAAQEYADFVVITSDNPRTEDPGEIIKDVLAGVDKTKPFIVIPDRRGAIKYAVQTSGEGDIVLLAGKGHEKYEITRDGMKPFDEEELVKNAFYSILKTHGLG